MVLLRIVGTALVIAGLAACTRAISETQKNRPIMDLAGSEWAPAENKFDQFVAFKSQGEIRGNSGCNQFFGSYELSGDDITLGPLASTKKACMGRMEAETEFMQRLQTARKFSATHKRLSLYGEDGIKVLDLQRRDWD